jgi:hypothetical protein
MFSRFAIFALVAAIVFIGSASAEPIGPNRSEPAPRKLREVGHLSFYRRVTLRGVLTFEHIRKLEPPPEERYSVYVLTTPGVYSASSAVSARESVWQTGLNDFYVEAPRELSLLWYRAHEVEISGQLLPQGRYHSPTLIVEKISRIRQRHI